ncbi:MAG: isoprenoid biosynthesis glyoxalase ElbB [Thiopseudomonas sp.]|jgi:enhancing lycopene biosynthesis protein 2|nr:isoprenoid biosynthesis glyoxalase ElbB [Thiopseudomonas sp.]MBP7997010.1 isoprenoid biosynthesis glyoxalase ElbB [Thiopseudomonas sp.]MBP8770982.1 isoprenoid biosynthesis glyoxalase ElbB [Thiopseudomonas sp.]HAB91286.1 isoprenoid biosynthesis protein ElbB [Pseudomonas sp.]
MNKKVAIILSGCGVFDGAEINETVLTALSLDQLGAQVEYFAPDINQHHVLNHLTGEEMPEQRNVLVESARITRGKSRDIRELKAADFDAVILPGGFGVAKNLSDFAFKGADCRVQEDILQAILQFKEVKKPVGLICISPALSAKIFGEGVRCTIGDDADTAAAITQMGGVHQDCAVDGIVVDEKNRLVTTPAYMLAQSISEAAKGIHKLVEQVLAMA